MENKLQGLPPHKRFRLLHPENPTINHQSSNSPISSILPAKKRKESRDLPSFLTNPEPVASTTLPAKKRICAFHPNILPAKPISPFDLNLDYDPKLEIDNASVIVNVSEKREEVDDVRAEEEEEEELEEVDEDGILCAVCQSTDGEPSDPIVFCDGCDLMVHTTCYGDPLIKGVPEGDWYCSQCQITDKNKDVSCCFCPVNGGALKPIDNGQWAHIVCALFIPEVFFRDPEGREGIDFSKVPARRWRKKCYVCRKTNGCAIDCSEEKCGLSFHVTCGLKEDLCIEYKEGRNRGAIVAGFCKSHTDLWMKQQGTGKYKIVARNED